MAANQINDGIVGEPDDLVPQQAETLAFIVEEGGDGQRLDAAAAQAAKSEQLPLSRTRLKELIASGAVFVDDMPCDDPSRKLRAGARVEVAIPAAVDCEPLGEAIDLTIVYEDDDVIVIDKPAGLVVHPAVGHATGTLVNALIGHCGASLSGIGGVRRPGIVHRLDKDTSGLLVAAKTDLAHQGLSALFADHGRTMPLERSYQALVWGAPPRPSGAIDAPLGRHPSDRLRMAVVSPERGREAITHWQLTETFGSPTPEAALLRCDLETGRTHQIRVHLSHVGHPVIGDPLYARGFRTKAQRLPPALQARIDGLDRQMLHAAVLGFEHPVTGTFLRFESQPPPDMADALAALRDWQVC